MPKALNQDDSKAHSEDAPRRRSKAIQLVYDRPIPILCAVLLVGFGGVGWYAARLSDRLIQSNAINQASHTAEMLASFRTIYTSDVVSRLKPLGVDIRHDYESHDGAIPLPATLSIKLGEQIGALGTGLEASLYSPYPFPWRSSEGGLRDDFREVAWEQLNEDPSSPFYRFEDYKGKSSIRYATADRLRPECVDCHNTHPQTPRIGWKANDVRGVLEVVLPLDAIREEMNAGLRNSMGLLGIAALLGVGCLAVAISQMRSGSRLLREQIEGRTSALNQSEADKSELQQLRDDLEKQVEDRTAELTERAESEASLAALSSRLQEGLTTEQIAGVALASMIESTEAHSGALYVLESDARLHRLASHALPPEAESQNVLSVGSGSVGQAARDRKMSVRDPGSQDWSVTFGLGRTPPKSIVTSPLVANDTLSGVVELYLLTELVKTRRDWLTKAAEITATSLRLVESMSQENRNDQIRRILDTALDAVISIREDSTITRWNAQAEETLGYTAEEALGSKVTDLIIPERYREAHANGLARFLESRERTVIGQRVELSALHKDGRELPVEIAINLPIETESGLEFSAFIRDISDRK